MNLSDINSNKLRNHISGVKNCTVEDKMTQTRMKKQTTKNLSRSAASYYSSLATMQGLATSCD